MRDSASRGRGGSPSGQANPAAESSYAELCYLLTNKHRAWPWAAGRRWSRAHPGLFRAQSQRRGETSHRKHYDERTSDWKMLGEDTGLPAALGGCFAPCVCVYVYTHVHTDSFPRTMSHPDNGTNVPVMQMTTTAHTYHVLCGHAPLSTLHTY